MDRLRVLAEGRGFFTRQDALEIGHDDKTIRRSLKVGAWVRIRNGSYTFPDLWAAHDDLSKHLVTGQAVANKMRPHVALSHTTAAAAHGFAMWRPTLTPIHVTRLDGGAGRTEAGVQHHEGFCIDDDVMELAGYTVVRPARAALEAASLTDPEGGLIILDSALHAGVLEAELADAFSLLTSWPHSRGLQVTLRMASGKAESPGESRSRYFFYMHGLPAPELQWHVYDETGLLRGVTDFAWPEHRLLGEFDGRVKYGRLLRPGEQPGDAVFREKVREDLLRRLTGWRMVRLVWSDLSRPAATTSMMWDMLGLSAA